MGKWIMIGLMLTWTASAAEPDWKACHAALDHARIVVQRLPPGSMARRFADSDLVQAVAEGGNGEYDDCLDYTAKAENEANRPQHDKGKPGLSSH